MRGEGNCDDPHHVHVEPRVYLPCETFGSRAIDVRCEMHPSRCIIIKHLTRFYNYCLRLTAKAASLPPPYGGTGEVGGLSRLNVQGGSQGLPPQRRTAPLGELVRGRQLWLQAILFFGRLKGVAQGSPTLDLF